MDKHKMDSPRPNPFRAIRKTLIGKLLKGKESATQLQTLLQKVSAGDRGSGFADELALQISRSFTESLSLLSSCELNEICQIAAADGAKRVSSGDRSSKSLDNGRKRPGVKDRRGCYRRRNSAQSWVVVSPTIEDGYAWRKYGQKEILNTEFPRCYFRCTHKNDQGCKATKQVQRIKEDPLMYQTTYFGNHTCQDTLVRIPQIISEQDPLDSCLLSFETTKTPNNKRDIHFPRSLTPVVVVNQEFKDETKSDESCLDSPVWQDMMTSSVSSQPQKLEPSNANNSGVYNEEVVSSFHSCSSTPLDGLDMEAFSTKFADLEHDLSFDEMGFL